MTWLVKAQDVSWLCVVESVYCVLPSWSRHLGNPLYGEAFILVSWCWSHCRRDVGADKMPDKIIFASMCWIYPDQVPVHSCTILHPMYSIGIQSFPSRNFGLRTVLKVLILFSPRFWRYLPFWLTVRVLGCSQRYKNGELMFGWSQQGIQIDIFKSLTLIMLIDVLLAILHTLKDLEFRQFCGDASHDYPTPPVVCSLRRDSKSIRNIVIRMFCYGSHFTSLISPSKGRLPCWKAAFL